MLHDFIDWILATVGQWGYTGIFVLMALESTVLPVPSELVLIPAGYLAWQGKMNFVAIVLASTFGSLAGAMVNYLFALWVGRPFLERWGRYFFVRPELLHKTDAFFGRHGHISTFTGRLLPGIRHLISLPAGLTRMNLATFSFYTCLGAGLWSTVLTVLGYSIGGNEDLIRQRLPQITVGVVVLVVLLIVVYIRFTRRTRGG
jgi:membrane protein DedA with SNARE-associated domain